MANPPVCRIMDYGKFRYEESQKAKESRKKTVNVSIKEMKYRPKIGKGDFDTKIRQMQEFLAEGHKVKVTMQFRGREMAHPELGSRILDEVVEQVGPHGKVETMARLDGRNMTMVLAPEKKAVAKKPHEPKARRTTARHSTNTAAARRIGTSRSSRTGHRRRTSRSPTEPRRPRPNTADHRRRNATIVRLRRNPPCQR